MDDKLAKRLGYPRPLEDGSFGVRLGFVWYRLGPEEFDRFAGEFAGLSWIRLADVAVVSLWQLSLFSLFVFPPELTSPTLYLMYASLVPAVTRSLVSNKRFQSAFPQAKKVGVSGGPRFIRFGFRGTGTELFLIGAGSLLLGWGLGERFPDAALQSEFSSGLKSYVVFSGFFFATWVSAWGIRLYYRATRGCRLTYDNLFRTEGPVSFRDAS